MASNLRDIRRKIKTVGSIWQITRAMHMVAAAKLKRVQARVEASRRYFEELSDITSSVAASVPAQLHPYLQQRETGTVGLVVMAGDKGLCGSHNMNILRLAEEFIDTQEEPVAVFAVGARAADYGRRRRWSLVDTASNPVDFGPDSTSIARRARGLYDTDEVQQLYVAYTEFLSPVRRVARVRQLLPIPILPAEEEEHSVEYLFNPPAEELLASLLPRTVEAQIVNLLFQAVASEHAARMTAMSAATENADEMRTSLTRQLNRLRQAEITTEILEVVGGAEALSGGD